jgi:hypothetical protein
VHAAGLLVRATSGDASLIFANPGDWGIDVFVGGLHGRVTVWQAKYFVRGVGRSQQSRALPRRTVLECDEGERAGGGEQFADRD